MSTESHLHSSESEEHPIQKLASFALTFLNFIVCVAATTEMWQATQSWRPFVLALLIIPIYMLSKVAWSIGDAFRGFVAPSAYFSHGAKDAFKKKVFWLVGPQATASFWTIFVAWAIGYYSLLPETTTSSKSEEHPIIEAQPVVAEKVTPADTSESKIDAAPIENRSETQPSASTPQIETADIEALAERIPENEPIPIQQNQSSPQVRKMSNPSFDCNQAATEQEHLICGSEELADLDNQLTDQYKNLMTQTANKVELRKDQVQWLIQVRGACHDTACMSAVHRNRIAQLEAVPR